MALITWNEEYLVNVLEIDQQHKKIVEIINRLYEGMQDGESKNVLHKILGDVVQYAAYHLGFEEKMLIEFSYPDATIHQQVHTDLIDQLKALIEKYETGSAALSPELTDFLKNWFVNHIMSNHKKYWDFLKSKGVS